VRLLAINSDRKRYFFALARMQRLQSLGKKRNCHALPPIFVCDSFGVALQRLNRCSHGRWVPDVLLAVLDALDRKTEQRSSRWASCEAGEPQIESVRFSRL
jgi:hypothetical protein